MKKKLLCMAAFAAVFFTARAQTTPPQPGDEISFNGYTIHLQKTPSGGYIYDILSNKSVVLHQDGNPFTGSKNGLNKKEDAIKAAKWEIIHISPVTGKPLQNNKRLPVTVAKQLNISLN